MRQHFGHSSQSSGADSLPFLSHIIFCKFLTSAVSCWELGNLFCAVSWSEHWLVTLLKNAVSSGLPFLRTRNLPMIFALSKRTENKSHTHPTPSKKKLLTLLIKFFSVIFSSSFFLNFFFIACFPNTFYCYHLVLGGRGHVGMLSGSLLYTEESVIHVRADLSRCIPELLGSCRRINAAGWSERSSLWAALTWHLGMLLLACPYLYLEVQQHVCMWTCFCLTVGMMNRLVYLGEKLRALETTMPVKLSRARMCARECGLCCTDDCQHLQRWNMICAIAFLFMSLL